MAGQAVGTPKIKEIRIDLKSKNRERTKQMVDKRFWSYSELLLIAQGCCRSLARASGAGFGMLSSRPTVRSEKEPT